MLELELIDEKNKWKQILQQYQITDVYFQYEYVDPMARHLNAEPLLVEYISDDGGFIYSLLIMDVAMDPKFRNLIPEKTYFDAETPYGYGGPCFFGDMHFDDKGIQECQNLLREKLRRRGVISQFVRYYPFMFQEGKSTIITDRFGTYKSTIYMDLTDEETIMSNLDPQYRRKVRKAVEAGVKIEHDKGRNIEEFIRLYNMTMEMHAADDMYFFDADYYDRLINGFGDHFEVFYARLNDKIVGASIFLYDSEYMHFHLGGRDIEAPNIPFENLLMVEAAKWGSKRNIKKLHIGGGLSEGDSLFQYKKKFNRSGMLPFYIGRMIFDDGKYKKLMQIREAHDENFDRDNAFYIQYRF